MSTTLIEIVLATGTDLERQAQQRIRALLDRFALDEYLYTATVLLDSSAQQSSAFPVPTLAADRLGLADEELLTVLLHGQMHWALNQREGGSLAVEEVKQRWAEDRDAGLEPPSPDALGQPCASGDYLVHVAVTAMEFAAMSGLVGRERAATVMTRLPGYGWLRDQLSDGTAGLEGYIARHGLGRSTQPPAVRDAGQILPIEPGGPLATLVTGDATEFALAERLSGLHARFDLGLWRFSQDVRLDAAGLPRADGEVPSISPFFLRLPDADLLLNYLQLQAMWQAGHLDPAELQNALVAALTGTGLDPHSPTAPPLSVIVGCAIALHALISLVGSAAAADAAARHPRNAQLYAAVMPHLAGIREAIRAADMDLVR